MSTVVDSLARLLAYKERRAIPIRQTSSISPDPARVLAIAPIKMVSEEIIQSVAFGHPDGQPIVSTRWNPLSRDTGDLEPLAQAMDAYVNDVLAANELPRIWLPHSSALTVVELLGHRYRRNQTATPSLRRLGEICSAIAEEARFPGQQLVAVAGELLKSHVVTGQSPLKDCHLGALMAWVNPQAGVDPAEEADRRALVPASGVLKRDDDDDVERLRREAKAGGPRGAAARATLEGILAAGARREWTLLGSARRAFWNLGLPGGAMAPLAEQTKRRTAYSFATPLGVRTSPEALSRELIVHEYASDVLEDVEHRSDDNLRERVRKKGRAIRVEVTQVVQAKKGAKPCDLALRTDQQALRVRVGTQLRTLSAKVGGRVTAVATDAAGRTTITLSLSEGIRSRPDVGWIGDLVDTAPLGRFLMEKFTRQALESMKDAKSPLIYGQDVAGTPAAGPPDDLLAIANGLRR